MNEYFNPFMSFSQGSDISDLGDLLRSATVKDISLIRTEASIVDNFEVGISGHLADFSYEVAAYRSYSELGTRSEYNQETGVYMPIREPQKIWGYEAQFSYQIQDNLATSVSYSWVEGKNTDKDTYLEARTISPPKFTATLDWQPVNEARIGLSYLYVGERKRFEPVNGKYLGTQGPVSSYNLVNLSSSYQINNWQLSLGVENLFNQNYYSARSQAYTFSGFNTKGLGTSVNLGVKATF
nr:TonB-dependent receptor [Shewanella psychropiezotolerans]